MADRPLSEVEIAVGIALNGERLHWACHLEKLVLSYRAVGGEPNEELADELETVALSIRRTIETRDEYWEGYRGGHG